MPSIEQQNYEEFQNKIDSRAGADVSSKIDCIFKSNNINENVLLKAIAQEDPAFANTWYDSFLNNVILALQGNIGSVQKIQDAQKRLQGVVYNKIKELEMRAYGTKENIDNSGLPKQDKLYYEKIRPIAAQARSTMAMMDAMGVRKDDAYKNLEQTLIQDKRLDDKQLQQIIQFQKNAFIVINAQSILLITEKLKESTLGESKSVAARIENNLANITRQLLSNPLQDRDISKSINILKESTNNLALSLQKDNTIFSDSQEKNEIIEGLKSLIPGYDTYAVISANGMDLSKYTREDAAKIGLDVLSIVPAVKLLSVGLKVVRVVKVVSTVSKAQKIINIANAGSEIGSTVINTALTLDNLIGQFGELKSQDNQEGWKNFAHILANVGIISFNALSSKYFIDTKKMQRRGANKEFIARVSEWFAGSFQESYLKHWKNI